MLQTTVIRNLIPDAQKFGPCRKATSFQQRDLSWGTVLSHLRNLSQPSHVILVLTHLLITSLKFLIRYSYKCEWLKVFSLSHYNLHVNWIHSSVTFIHSYLVDFSLKGDNCSLLLKCTESCAKYFWCSLYFMFSFPLGQIAASSSILNSYP